jgi:5'-nucleotidase
MKRTKKILYIDMDGVVADFWGFIKMINPQIDDKRFYPTEKDKDDEVDRILDMHPHIYRYLKPIKGAIESTKPLFKKYEVYFLSSPSWNTPESYTDKRVWIEKHYGKLAEKRLILSSRKDLAIGDLLIDDRLKNGAGNFKGKLIQFGTKKYPNWEAVLKDL